VRATPPDVTGLQGAVQPGGHLEDDLTVAVRLEPLDAQHGHRLVAGQFDEAFERQAFVADAAEVSGGRGPLTVVNVTVGTDADRPCADERGNGPRSVRRRAAR